MPDLRRERLLLEKSVRVEGVVRRARTPVAKASVLGLRRRDNSANPDCDRTPRSHHGRGARGAAFSRGPSSSHAGRYCDCAPRDRRVPDRRGRRTGRLLGPLHFQLVASSGFWRQRDRCYDRCDRGRPLCPHGLREGPATPADFGPPRGSSAVGGKPRQSRLIFDQGAQLESKFR